MDRPNSHDMGTTGIGGKPPPGSIPYLFGAGELSAGCGDAAAGTGSAQPW
ncbi:MAG: hypothetical protein QOJ54_1150 [Aliidongia sp.]|nr:hypothetical protein [Aliidongia sp.]